MLKPIQSIKEFELETELLSAGSAFSDFADTYTLRM